MMRVVHANSDAGEHLSRDDDLAAPMAIRVEGLIRRFGDVTAVDEVSLNIRRGEIYGFLGPNGAGKSTMVRVLCTLLAPSGGRAVVAGYDVGREAKKVCGCASG